MSFAQVISELIQITEDELGDSVSITDGVSTLPVVAGFYRRQWEERMSAVYGFAEEAPTFECQRATIQSLSLSTSPGGLKLTADGVIYQVMDVRSDGHGSVLLVLSR